MERGEGQSISDMLLIAPGAMIGHSWFSAAFCAIGGEREKID